MLSLVKKILDPNAREIKRFQKKVEQINLLESQTMKLTDEALKEKTLFLKERLSKGETLDNLLVEAFALVREASRRTIGLRHFDVQLIGGMVLHEGRIAEMKTGEGKTLVATLPIYLNALEGKGIHLVTVNDYLAKRDACWMGPIYNYLGLSVGVIQHDSAFIYDPNYIIDDPSLNLLRPVERKEAYLADITYGTNNELGFDYLRDNMVMDLSECVLRELNYAIVDEVDSILIDEARTPLIISGRGAKSTDLYQKFSRLANRLIRDKDYHVDEKAHSVPLTDEGTAKVEEFLGITNLYDNQYIEFSHHINQALRAKELFKKDVDYVIKDGEVVIVDEFTGRLMFGRRYSDGLHQGIEAKENVKVRQEDQTLASITFQNFFRIYKKLAGMTGTAATEEREFRNIYNLDVVVIPTHKPMIRKDHPDQVYKNEKIKFKKVIEEIEELHKIGKPVLVGTRSIEKSEFLSMMLKRKGIPHQVLNAKYHEKEAQIIAQAGKKGAVTIATNMAGRGVDIILSGNPPNLHEAEEIIALGGLHIIGTERHESRRIDNQLRGRTGRQGDPGSSRFYVGLDDELMRLFGSDRIVGLMERLGIDEETSIEHSWITKAIENAQTKVESHHFDIRKTVLEYDDVMNKQREIIYLERRKVLEGYNLKSQILEMLNKFADDLVNLYAPENIHPEEWDLKSLFSACKEDFPLPFEAKIEDLTLIKVSDLKEVVLSWILRAYQEKEERLGEELMRSLERFILLQMIDTKWIDHLYAMDMLREGIGLRAYGQKDPRIEYINESFAMFESLKSSIQEDAVKYLFKVQLVKPQERTSIYIPNTNRGERNAPLRKDKKIGRNDPCACGSGKKYKKCCGING
ncbi:MAG: preprotein translocase subunit SecA [Armatimonadetes bacterium]|nr:preprotein translocase subunit SecA [Armatimonadota bacterium]